MTRKIISSTRILYYVNFGQIGQIGTDFIAVHFEIVLNKYRKALILGSWAQQVRKVEGFRLLSGIQFGGSTSTDF